MDYSVSFNKAWSVYQKNFMDLTIGYLLTIVCSVLTLGILAPGLWAGYNLLLLNALRGKKITPTGIFSGLSQYWNVVGLAIYSAIILLLLCITIIGIIPAVLIGTWWMYAILFIVDKKYSITKAMAASKQIVRKNNIWLHFIFLVIISILGNSGFALAYIGALITMPFSLLAFCAAYDSEVKKSK